MTIIERSAWAGDRQPTGPIEAEDDVRFLIVHHTVASNTYGEDDVGAILRSMYNFHTNDKGWSDVAYNFCVDRFGRVWEARAGSAAGPVRGDATGGSQGHALLCAFIGDHSTEMPSEAATQAMGGLLAALGGRYGIDLTAGASTTFVSRGSNRHAAGVSVTAPTVCPHRLMSQTACPGDAGVAHIENQLIPIASGAAPTITTTTVPPTTTTESTTIETTVESTTTESTIAESTVAESTVAESTVAESTTTSEAAVSSTEAPLDPRTEIASDSNDAAIGDLADGADDAGDDSIALYGAAGLIAAGVAGLIGLRRRSTPE